MIFQSICGWPSKAHLFNFMHQWDDTSCFVQCDSLLHCITQHADATRHAKLTWSSNPGNLRQQDPPLQLALFDKPHYSPLSLLFFFCTNDENGALWKRCLGNGSGMWITSGWIGVGLMQFLCFGLLKREGSLAFGFPWEGKWMTGASRAVPSPVGRGCTGNSGFPQLLALLWPALRTPPALQRGCGFNKPRMNSPLSAAPLHPVWAPAATWPLWINSLVEWHREGHCCSSSHPVRHSGHLICSHPGRKTGILLGRCGADLWDPLQPPWKLPASDASFLCLSEAWSWNSGRRKGWCWAWISPVPGCDMPRVSLSIQCFAWGKIFA